MPKKYPVMTEEKVLLKMYGKSVIQRWFRLPSGKVSDFLVWGGSVTPTIVFPLTRNNEVVALRQFRYAPNGGEVVLELPGGVPDGGELDAEIASRELAEETGYIAERIVRLGAPRPFEPAACITSFTPVIALGCEKVGEPKPDENEFLEVVRVPLAEWAGMVSRDIVRDPKTIATTMLALFYLGASIKLPPIR